MPFQLPDLATKTYKDILDEMIVSIPKYTDRWTNYNPSDPGITILELLSWIGETTLYRIDRMPEESYVNFLRLVAGAAGADEVESLLKDPDVDRSHRKLLEFLKEIENGTRKTIPEIKAEALDFLSSRYRAVTEDDFRELAIEATDSGIFEAKVKRAIVYRSPDEEKVEIVIAADRQDKYKELIESVRNYLNPRALIGTIIEVKEPAYTGVAINIKIVCQPYARIDKVKENVRLRVSDHLDPFIGGPEKKGWPYGRLLTIYEIVQIVEKTDGVKLADSVVFDNNSDLKMKKIDGLIDPTVTVDVVEEK